MNTVLSLFSIIDALAVAWFVVCWAAYTWVADYRGSRKTQGLNRVTYAYRENWMRRMLERENRIVDSTLVGNLMRSVSFFASTTMIIIGGLVATLGSVKEAVHLIDDLPFTASVSPLAWKLKLLMLISIFVYAFFKFTWSLRQFNYCSIMMGAAPLPSTPAMQRDTYACQLARLLALAGDNFNRGLRASYFGSAVLSWFIHPWLFIAVTSWVILVLYRRQFGSRTLQALLICQESSSR
ncbi:MAG: DUF599 domain-containing protein [Gammaproteobacteria bacterium]|nr:DUF599 domain-containing protein [Gammaproteobacteria bacterium]MCP5424425.1 DUF599 domain-containing protein [Gammaproteobacteria bacterium]MCP5458419.1 DUF599 domain-containing protein [Gammaproteobacteria bacterium]